MNNFRIMFPELTPQQIENALRKNDGDVGNTVDDLLKLSGSPAKPTPTNTNRTNFPPNPTNYNNSFDYGSSAPNSSRNQPNCEEDEKIALMLQNREFLRYLRSNPAFMRELNYDSTTNTYFPSSSSSPRRHESVLSRCKRQHGSWTTHQPPASSQVPTADYYDTERTPIPDGPLVDPCERPLTRLSKKIKSKLPSLDSGGGVPKPEDIYPHTVTVDYPTSDESFMHRLRNMSRNSQSMFLGLAKKFQVSKKNGGLVPDSYAVQTNEFSYDLHRNDSESSHHHENTSKFL